MTIESLSGLPEGANLGLLAKEVPVPSSGLVKIVMRQRLSHVLECWNVDTPNEVI